MKLSLGLSLNEFSSTSISAAAAKALLEYSPTFQYHTLDTGDMVVTNKGAGGTSNDLLLYSGRALQLGATNELSMPTGATLGSEQNPNPNFDTDLSGWTYDSAYYKWDANGLKQNVSNGDQKYAYFESSVKAGDTVRVEFYVFSIDRTPAVCIDGRGMLYTETNKMSDNFTNSSGKLTFKTTGHYWLEYTASVDNETFGVFAVYATFIISSYSVKVIQPSSKTIAYFDVVVNALTQIDLSAEVPSMTYTVSSNTVNNIITTDTPFSQNDLNAIGNNPNLIAKLAMSATGSTPELSVTLASDDAWYPCAENSGATVYDARSSNTAVITNYAETIRTNVNQLSKGLQTTCLLLDATWVPTAYVEDSLNWHGVEYGDGELNLSTLPKFWLEEIVDGTIYQHNYDGTNLTTYTDGTAGTPAAHTPENVNYTLGRGVYPTLSTDPTVQGAIPYFSVFSDDYDIYDQSKRYTYLQGV